MNIDELNDLEIPEMDFEPTDEPVETPTDLNTDDNPDDTGLDEPTDNPDDQDDLPVDTAPEGISSAQALYEEYVELGYIDPSDEFDGSHDWIQAQLEELPSKLLSEEIGKLPAVTQKVLTFATMAKQDLSIDELQAFVKELAIEINGASLDTADEAREFLEAHFTKQGLTPRAIQAQLDDLEDQDLLVSKAKELNTQSGKTDKMIADKKEANDAAIKAQQDFAKAVYAELEASSWKPAKKQEVVQIANRTTELLGTIGSKPKAYIQFLDFLSLFNGEEFNLEPYREQGAGRATKRLQNVITKNQISSAAATSGVDAKDDKTLSTYERYDLVT